MKRLVRVKTALLISVVLMLGLGTGECQGFVNLGFESATIVPTGNPVDPFEVEFGPAFPGWTARIGSYAVATAAHDTIPLNSSGISIMDSAGYGLIAGHYTAVLPKSGVKLPG
jgi:hypothetical protein